MSAISNHANNQSLTIMQVVPALQVGGVERGTVEFAKYLKASGHRPVVVSAGGDMVQDLLQSDIEHITLNVNKKSFSSLLSVKRLRALISQYQVDVLHARSRIPAWLCYLALKKMKQHRPAFVTTLHGLHSVSQYSAVMAKGDRVIAVSQAAKDYLQRHYQKHLKHPPTVIHRGIDEAFVYGHQSDIKWVRDLLQRFPQLSNSQKVLLPGRLSRVKGVENMIPWLKTTADDACLLLTASPEESRYSQQVKQLFMQHQVAHKVVWLGVQRQMPDLYAFVDLVVSVNNKPESFGRTVLEALSIGKPVLALAHGGVTEIMQKLFPAGMIDPQDAPNLASHINRLLAAPGRVKPHDMYRNETMFQQTLGVYQELLDESA